MRNASQRRNIGPDLDIFIIYILGHPVLCHFYRQGWAEKRSYVDGVRLQKKEIYRIFSVTSLPRDICEISQVRVGSRIILRTNEKPDNSIREGFYHKIIFHSDRRSRGNKIF